MTNYKDLSETEKDVAKLEGMDKLNANTDDLESKLDRTNSLLSTISGKLDTIIENQGA